MFLFKPRPLYEKCNTVFSCGAIIKFVEKLRFMMPKKAPDPALKKIVVPSRTDIIETHLRDYFKQQQFSAGDAIPPETELAQTLGVSRNAVREALSRFRMLGIVESKTRTGMVLGQPDIAQAIEKVVDLMVLSESSKKELFEIRIALEIGIADFVFMQQTPEQIAVLEGNRRPGDIRPNRRRAHSVRHRLSQPAL